MSTGLKAPASRGLSRPAPIKKSGLAKPGLTKTTSGKSTASSTKTPSTSKSSSRESAGTGPVRSASRGVLKSSASSHSINSGLSRSGSSTSMCDMSPLKIGTRVVTKDTNLEGTVRFYGEPQFARGNWVGVELDVEQGKNDGEVKGVRYFQCKPNCGLFCKPEKLTKFKEPVMRPQRTPSQANVSTVDYEAKFGLRVGGKCVVNGAKEGTLLFVGLTAFAKGVWAGVALDTCDGKNDGSVKGERYFTCDPGYGLFSQATKIQMISSPTTSSSSLASFETPRKATNSEDVMKPDFVNRTPASTPGIKSSLSGLLSKSRDIESMQKNIGDLQQKLSEVKGAPARNGPSISALLHRKYPTEASDEPASFSSSSDLDLTLTDELVNSDTAESTSPLPVQTPDLFEEPLSEYCMSPSPVPSNPSSVNTAAGRTTQKQDGMVPDFANRRDDHDISEIIASKFKKTMPGQDGRFVRQNIKKWRVRARRKSDSSSNITCPRHGSAASTVRRRSYSTSKPDDNTRVTQSDTHMTRGLSHNDLQKLDQIADIFEAFKSPIEVAAGRRSDVKKRMGKGGSLSQLLDNGAQTPTKQSSSDQYEQLKKLHEESEKERSDLAERVKASESEKLTYEARLAEVAEAAASEKWTLSHKMEQQNKEFVVLNNNNAAQIAKLQDHISKLETELAAALEKITEYEDNSLENDNSAELIMNREQIAELQSELKSLRGTREGDESKIAQLESELTDAIQLSETFQLELDNMSCSQDGVSEQLAAAQHQVSELEQQLEDVNNSLADYKSNTINSDSVLATERQASARLEEDLDSAQQQALELDSEILSMRSAHEVYVQSSDKKLAELEEQLREREETLSNLKSELSVLSSSSSSDKIHLEQKLQDSLSNLARLEEQTGRDAARITDLENLVSSAASDGNTQLLLAHKKISELEKMLRDRDTASNEELGAVHDTVTELRVQLNREKQRATEELETANKRCKDLQVSLEKVQMERSMEQTQTEKDIGELQLQLAETDKLRADNSRLNNNINTLQTQLATLHGTSNELENANRVISSFKQQLESARSEQAHLVASLENNIDELETRLATANNDRAAEEELRKKQSERITALEEEGLGLREKLADVETSSAQRITKLETQLEEMELETDNKTAEIGELREEFDMCKQQLTESELQLRDLAEEFDTKKAGNAARVTAVQRHLDLVTEEKKALAVELLTITNELGELKIKTNRQSDEEIENLHKQIGNLSEENEVLKLSFEEKNTEFEELTSEVSNLRQISETAFTELEKNDLQFTTYVKKLKTTEFQLDDALCKMKELQTKINDLEEEIVREKSRARELEQRLNSPPVMSFENIDNLSNISSSPPIPAPNYIPDRIFCDNCDVFDDHDTENCRIEFPHSADVEGEDKESSSPGGIRHGGHRGLSGRPYCTVCEMFGHVAEECEDDMTF